MPKFIVTIEESVTYHRRYLIDARDQECAGGAVLNGEGEHLDEEILNLDDIKITILNVAFTIEEDEV